MFAIYKKEMRSYFINAIGYVYIAVFLAVSAFVCCLSTLHAQSYDVSTYFTLMLFSLVVLIPLLTMKLFSEERKLRTEQLLLTAPVTITGMVLAKFLAAMTMFTGTVLVSCINFIPLYHLADEARAADEYAEITSALGPNTAIIAGNLIGILLVGAAFISVGVFISALTENQLAAAVSTMGIILAMIIIGVLNSLIDNYAVRFVLSWFSVLERFNLFGYGIFDFNALLYYLSICTVFIFLTIRVYEKRRWS
ncbi:MAG: hypothetical protein IJZ02_01600 [Clostridia bacterium]|nr:hypothetical protein [Clostridia bacterium]